MVADEESEAVRVEHCSAGAEDPRLQSGDVVATYRLPISEVVKRGWGRTPG